MSWLIDCYSAIPQVVLEISSFLPSTLSQILLPAEAVLCTGILVQTLQLMSLALGTHLSRPLG